jgi:hypothetical protein
MVRNFYRVCRRPFATITNSYGRKSDFSIASTGPAAVAVEFPRLTCVSAFAGNCLRWILESVAVLAFGITSQMADEILATKLILKRKFGVGHAAYYIQAPSPQLFATWGTGIPFYNQSIKKSCSSVYWRSGLRVRHYRNPRAILIANRGAGSTAASMLKSYPRS